MATGNGYGASLDWYKKPAAETGGDNSLTDKEAAVLGAAGLKKYRTFSWGRT